MPSFVETVEKSANKAIGKAIDNPLEAITTADSVFYEATNILPTFPWETPIPIPRRLYNYMKEIGVKFNG